MATKDYRDLQAEVWETGKCSGCGACTAVCPADALYFPEGTMVAAPKNTGYCKYATDGVDCGACYEVCPRTGEQPEGALGEYIGLFSAKAAFEVPGRQSGGAVTAILAGALDAGLIDAVVTVTEDRWTLKPSSVVITGSEVLIGHAGSRYSWWVPLLAALKTAVIEKKCRRIAIVGVPCVVQAVSRMRMSRHDLVRPYGSAIRLVIGLFCTETFDYSALVIGKLKTDKKIDPAQVKKLDVRGKLQVLLQDCTTASVPMDELEACVRPGCHICTDFTSLFADISAGAVGSQPGSTTLVIRTPAGKSMMENSVQRHMLTVSESVDIPAIEKLVQMKVKKAKASRKSKV